MGAFAERVMCPAEALILLLGACERASPRLSGGMNARAGVALFVWEPEPFSRASGRDDLSTALFMSFFYQEIIGCAS